MSTQLRQFYESTDSTTKMVFVQYWKKMEIFRVYYINSPKHWQLSLSTKQHWSSVTVSAMGAYSASVSPFHWAFPGNTQIPSFSKARQEQDKLLPFAHPLAATVPSSSLFAHEVPYWSGSSYSAPGCPSHTTSGLHTAKAQRLYTRWSLTLSRLAPLLGLLVPLQILYVCSNVGFPHVSGSELLFIFCLFLIKFY